MLTDALIDTMKGPALRASLRIFGETVGGNLQALKERLKGALAGKGERRGRSSRQPWPVSLPSLAENEGEASV
jgi:hypothetical protein